MAKWREITDGDLDRLCSALQYVIDRKGTMIDDTMVEYLAYELKAVGVRFENEKTGDGDATVSEIDAVIGYLQNKDE